MNSGRIAASDAEELSLATALRSEGQGSTHKDGTARVVSAFQKSQGTSQTEIVDQQTAEALNKVLRDLGALDSKTEERVFRVEGQVTSLSRPGVAGLRIEIVDKNVGQATVLAETATNARGAYEAVFSTEQIRKLGKEQADLQARVFSGEKILGASEVRYNASKQEVLNIAIDETASAALASEHETLLGEIAAHFAGELRDLKETDDRQDITYLSNKTGRDARGVALAALVDQFSARTA